MRLTPSSGDGVLFSKLLIANRGEIACRIIKTCRRLGIEAVAVYSCNAEGMPLEFTRSLARRGGVASRCAQSRVGLSGHRHDGRNRTPSWGIKIIGEVSPTVHPGYGFLSENPRFAEACADSGIVFVGPPTEVIRLMGNKREARRRLAEHGVPVLPGTAVSLDGVDDMQTAAATVGFPLMVKASEGGGGIGMQLVAGPDLLDRSVRRARSSSRRAFGSEDMYFERFIPDARHVEVQIISDADGVSSHLWERECSVQRRHQKVIEEAPSPSISESARERLLASAVQAAESVGYRNVGTFEFLVDQEDDFYFLEANTRLQVEHATTEMVTGVDIVERQLRIAAGLATDVRPAPVKGHAIECRIYAEDPETFVPSPGRLAEFEIPTRDGLRVDTGFRAGDEVSSFFDPLLAKLIAWGESRDAAVASMREALAETRIAGIKTNVPTLLRALEQPDFVRGRYTTDLLGTLS